MKKHVNELLKKAMSKVENIDVLIGGDLINQLSPTNFAARNLAIPFLGVFSACASSMESVILGSLLLESGNARSVLSGRIKSSSSSRKTV